MVEGAVVGGERGSVLFLGWLLLFHVEVLSF